MFDIDVYDVLWTHSPCYEINIPISGLTSAFSPSISPYDFFIAWWLFLPKYSQRDTP